MTKRFAILILLVACGDNGKPMSTPDAGDVDAAAVKPRAVVVAGDFVTPGFSGVMSSLDVDSMQMSQNVAPAGAIGNDPVLRRVGDELYVVNRSGGNSVTILDADTFALKEQLGTGASSNPNDVAVFGDKLYIPAAGTAGVVVATRGSTTTTLIDLSSLDPDGNPECVSAYRVGNDIYVACELLDATFTPRENGKVVVIDAMTDTVRTTLTLSTPNPFGVFEPIPASAGGGLVIPTFDFLAPATRCLERITTGASPAAAGCLVQNSDLGGYVVHATFQQVGTTQLLWMIVNNGDFTAETSRLHGYDLGNQSLWPDAVTPVEQVLTDLAVCPDGLIVVADKTMTANGLRVYDGLTEKTTMPLAVGLRPQASPAIACY